MASSGTINGNQVGTQPYLRLEWLITNQEIANNRSRVRLRLRLISPYNIQFSAPKTGALQGVGFTYSGGASGTNVNVLLNERFIWVNHNSDGTRSATFSGLFNIQITWGGSTNLSRLTVSGNANLDTIPRASSITSFSNFSVRENRTNTFSLGLSRASSSFTHDIALRINNENVQTWTGQGLPTSLTLSSSASNRILNIMRNTTSMTIQLRVQTKSGSTNIGSVVTRNATVSIHSSIVPSIPSVVINEAVASIKSGLDVYVQTRSRLSISMNTAAGFGARDKSFRIRVDGQSANSNSFTTQALRNHGTLTVIFDYENTRSQKVSTSRTITVYPYHLPAIRSLSAERSDANGAVNPEGDNAFIRYRADISPLNNKNTKSFIINFRKRGGTWSTENVTPASGYSVNDGIVLSDFDIDFEYDVRLVVTDFFGNNVQTTILPSGFDLINFHPSGKGLAFGGVMQREEGFDVYFHTRFFEGVYFEHLPTTAMPVNANLNDFTQAGMYYETSNARASNIANTPVNEAFSLLVEQHAGVKQTFTRHHHNDPRTWIRNFYSGTWGSWREIQFK